MNRLAPRGASGLKCPECPNPTVSFCLAPRGASGLKSGIIPVNDVIFRVWLREELVD